MVPDSWPTEGAIVGTNVQMRYRDGPLVLKGVDFSIRGGEKIGIAGRTGSGKSSLMIALFRIQELSEGTMYIDGINTKTIPLRTLRSRIGIIPQGTHHTLDVNTNTNCQYQHTLSISTHPVSISARPIYITTPHQY